MANQEKKLKPISRKARKIVGQLATGRVVEDLIRNVTHHSTIDGDLADLVQIIYLALLQMEASRLQHLTETGGMHFYIVRMIRNQYFSKNSPFHYEVRRFRDASDEISPQMADTFDAEKDYTNR